MIVRKLCVNKTCAKVFGSAAVVANNKNTYEIETKLSDDWDIFSNKYIVFQIPSLTTIKVPFNDIVFIPEEILEAENVKGFYLGVYAYNDTQMLNSSKVFIDIVPRAYRKEE